jgi:hypothetical protein
MKKFILILGTIGFLSTGLITSCKKYEDGPAFSLRTKKARLTGDWKIDKVLYNNEDITADYIDGVGANFVLDIEKDGTYKQMGKVTDAGTWKLGEDKDDVFFLSNDPGSKEEAFRITRLKNKELWLKQTQSNGDIFIQKFKQ